MLNFIKEKLQNVYTNLTSQLQSIFAAKTIDQATINQIQELLLRADTGVATTKKIIADLNQAHQAGTLQQGTQLQTMLQTELEKLLLALPSPQAQVFLLVGINGSGKTTFIGKLARQLATQNKSCIIVAADTFRAAACAQLSSWAEQSRAKFISGKPQQDPASIVFDACQTFKKEQCDALIIDTAGRLSTKEGLMQELEKIKRTVTKQLPDHQICTLLTIDAMLGQNSLEQARSFHDICKIDGIVLTKMDGSGKGGIVFAITEELKIPIAFLSWGETIEDMAPFDAKMYVANLLGVTRLGKK
jgi:fused signal recognition particle receptor